MHHRYIFIIINGDNDKNCLQIGKMGLQMSGLNGNPLARELSEYFYIYLIFLFLFYLYLYIFIAPESCLNIKNWTFWPHWVIRILHKPVKTVLCFIVWSLFIIGIDELSLRFGLLFLWMLMFWIKFVEIGQNPGGIVWNMEIPTKYKYKSWTHRSSLLTARCQMKFLGDLSIWKLASRISPHICQKCIFYLLWGVV